MFLKSVLSDIYDKAAKHFYTAMKYLGESIWIVFLIIVKILLSLAAGFFSFLWEKTINIRLFILNFLKYFGVFLVSPFLKIYTGFSKMTDDVKASRKEKGFFGGLRAFGSHFFVFFFGKNGFAVTLFNYSAPVVSIIFLFNVITYSTGINYAVKLDVNGQFLGYIENEQIFNEAEMIVEKRLNSQGSFKQLEIEPIFSIEKIGYTETLTQYQVADMVLSNSDINVEYAYGIFVNGELIGAVKDNSRIKSALQSLLNAYRTGEADEEVKFEANIDCDQTGFYISDSIINDDIIIQSFTRMKDEAKFYTVTGGDSHSLIANKLNLTEDEIERLNPGFKESSLFPGDLIKYSVDVPQYAVSVTRTEVYEIEIPYETEYRDDSTLYVDTERVYREGIAGVKVVTARVKRVNDVEVERSELKSVINSLPTTQIILRGTKPSPEDTYSREIASFGKFIWPVSRSVGYISELTQWDGGYYGHSGIDIAAPYGTPIYAGASGKVVMSQWYYGYGYCVQIEHSNGLRTLYAHCSKLYVSPGEQVSQGQCIALVGQTGTAIGNHVHFEVRNGNTILNPIHYLD